MGIARVALMIDDLPYRDSQPEVSGAVPVFTVTMNWLAQGIGYHSLTAVAYRPDGTESRPRTINVLVTAPEDESSPRPAVQLAANMLFLSLFLLLTACASASAADSPVQVIARAEQSQPPALWVEFRDSHRCLGRGRLWWCSPGRAPD